MTFKHDCFLFSSSVYLAGLAVADAGFLLCALADWSTNIGFKFYHKNGKFFQTSVISVLEIMCKLKSTHIFSMFTSISKQSFENHISSRQNVICRIQNLTVSA